jgi:hypothetical protein
MTDIHRCGCSLFSRQRGVASTVPHHLAAT